MMFHDAIMIDPEVYEMILARASTGGSSARTIVSYSQSSSHLAGCSQS